MTSGVIGSAPPDATELAATGPWPTGSAPVLFVCDAANDIERRLLVNWLAETAPSDRSEDVSHLHVRLDHPEPTTPPELQRALADATCRVVPIRIGWVPGGDAARSGPRVRDLVFGDPRRPRPAMARLIERRHPERIRRVVGASATVDELTTRRAGLVAGEAEVESLAEFVLRMAGVALDVAERRLQGRRYKVPRNVIPGVEASPTFRAAAAELSTELGQSAAEVGAEARGYLEEMVASPSTFFIDWTGKITGWLVSLAYDEVVVDPVALERARESIGDNPAALLWTHKSHVDGIALLSVLYDNDFPTPHSMGGINMSFGGLGFLGRRAGVVYIRRSFQDNPVYKAALRQYLGYLMGKGFPFSWALEGTRSRTGKLMPPRYGLLKYIVDGAHATQAENLHLIPIAINYDLIGDVSDYAREELGTVKKAENLGWFLSYVRRLRTPMGRVYVDFAEPVVLEGSVPAAEDAGLEQVTFEVARRVNSVVPVTLPSLMCMVLLGAAPRALTYAELDRRLQSLLIWLRDRDIRLASSFDTDDLDDLSALAAVMFERGLVHRYDDGPQTVYAIGEDQYPAAGYYRNNIVHYFVNKAMAELALLQVAGAAPEAREDAFWAELRWLRDALKFEFFHTPSADLEAVIDEELSAHEPDWRDALAGSSDDVLALVRRCRPVVAHSVLQPYIESYGVAAEVLAAVGDEPAPDEKVFVQQSLAFAEQSFLQGRLTTRASMGKQLFKGAHQLLDDKGLIAAGPGAAAGREALAARFAELGLRLGQIRQMALEDLGPVPVAGTPVRR